MKLLPRWLQALRLLGRIARAPRRLWSATGRTAPASIPAPQTSVRVANGRIIHVDPNDQRGARLIETGGNFNPPTLAMWRMLLRERDWTHVIDVGANYGEMIVGADIPASATITALEPNPHVLPYLQRTIGESGLNVSIVAKAASARSGGAALIADRTWSGLSTLEAEPSSETAGHVLEVVQVPTTTLASLVPSPPDGAAFRVVVKIDVEGHELSVLEGARTLIDRAEQFAALVEIHHAVDPTLDSMLSQFSVELYDPTAKALVPVQATHTAALREEIAAKGLYAMDAVLRPRQRSASS